VAALLAAMADWPASLALALAVPAEPDAACAALAAPSRAAWALTFAALDAADAVSAAFA